MKHSGWLHELKRSVRTAGFAVLVGVVSIHPAMLVAATPDFFVPGSVTLAVEPAAAMDSVRWQLVSSYDEDGKPVLDDVAWLTAGASLDDVAPGSYTVAVESDGFWVTPELLAAVVSPGRTTVVGAACREATAYDSVSDIPVQNVRHGDVLRFAVLDGSSLTRVEPHRDPDVVRDVTFDRGVVTYRPSPAERQQFTLTFRNGANENNVVVNPLSILPSETAVIEYRGDFPHPEAGERKAYLTIDDRDSLAAKMFNHEQQKVRTVTITGQRVVFAAGNELHRSFAYTDQQLGNENVETMTIYADQVIIRDPVHLPGTNVMIHARELHFEGEGALITTPTRKAAAANGYWKEGNQLAPVHGANGSGGLRSGDVNLLVAGVFAEGDARRLILKGGPGQHGGLGRNGPAISSRKSYTTYQPDASQPAFPSGWSNRVIGAIFTRCCLGCGEHSRQGRTSCIRSGWDAIADGAPGKGGSAGKLTAPVDLSFIADLSVGQWGRATSHRSGSLGDSPANAIIATIWFDCFGAYANSWGSTSCGNRHGTSQSARPAVGADPATGRMEIVSGSLSWLHPVAIRRMLEYVRDAYLNGHPEIVREVIEPYARAIAAHDESPEDNPSGNMALEISQLESEIATLVHRLDNNLDYFGFPAGWVPMLSFEVTHIFFRDEVEAAGDILYLTHYLRQNIDAAQAQADALSRLQNELSREINEFRDQLADAQSGFESLSFKAAIIDQEIRAVGREIDRREAELRERAKLNAGLKKAFRVLGNVLPLIPVGQPALGLAGSGLTAASKFNEQSALDSAIEGTNLAHEFLQSHMQESLEEFEAATGPEGVDPLGAAFVARQNALQGFDAALVGVNQTLREAQTWESDVDREVQMIAAEDPEHRDLVRDVRKLNREKKRFGEEMAVLLQFAKKLMNGINQNSLALDNLELVDSFEKLDEHSFQYIKEMERRAKDRLLRFQYYMIKAYQYRTVQPYDEIDDQAFQLDAVYTHFAENFTDVPAEAGVDILSRQSPSLTDVYTDQIRAVTAKIVDHLITSPPEQTETQLAVDLTPAELERLNSWDNALGPNPGVDLTINLAELGLFDQGQENLRIFDLEVDRLEATPRAGSDPARVSVLIEHSGESLISSKGETYKFDHYRTLTSPPIVWRARKDPGNDEPSSPELSAASNSLLETLLSGVDRQDVPDDLLLYSRPAANARLRITKETLSDFDEMNITALRVLVKVDFSEKEIGRPELEIRTEGDDGEALSSNIVVRTGDPRGDENRRADGRGEFTRTFREGEPVTLEAAQVHGSYRFDRWINRRRDTVGNGPVLAITMPISDSATITKYRAIYTRDFDVEEGSGFQRGDANADGAVDLSDGIAILNTLFLGGVPTSCEKTTDVNDDGAADISDPIALLSYLFTGGSTPSAPFGDCGSDPTDDLLTCRDHTPCS